MWHCEGDNVWKDIIGNREGILLGVGMNAEMSLKKQI